jgi:hypothetical protein
MRVMFVFGLALFAACSNAADPKTDAPPGNVDAPAVDAPPVDAPAPLKILVVNEVAAGETPDWIEVVNVSNAAVQLSDFVYCDVPDDFVKAKAFPAMMLAPGAYHAQDIDDVISGFKLGSDEQVWVYRASDRRVSDGVDWAEGAAPAGMSYRRSPDKTGDFATGAQSKGIANP